MFVITNAHLLFLVPVGPHLKNPNLHTADLESNQFLEVLFH